MDLLKKELERKRKAIELAKSNASSSTVIQSKKKRTFLRAGELRKFQEQQEEEELEERRRRKRGRDRKKKDGEEKDGNKEETDEKRRKASEDETKAKRKNEEEQKDDTPYKNETSSREEEEEKLPTEHQSTEKIISLLRSLGQPIKLFGESSYARYKRYQAALETLNKTNVVMSEMDEYKLGSGHGIRNPFLDKDDTNDGGEDKNRRDDDDDEEEENVAKKSDNKEEEDKDDDPHKRIHRFFKSLLKQWEEDLLNRPDHLKRTAAGKNETKTLKQCRDYIRPLFKLCKTRRLESNMMNHILKIVSNCEKGEFVKAHDAYMDVAIGRAAWPIGVTMVGIHARSGRAKIESSNVAHVMNSELQRKYLTSVKRLMSYCQKKRVDVDPSKKVMNM